MSTITNILLWVNNVLVNIWWIAKNKGFIGFYNFANGREVMGIVEIILAYDSGIWTPGFRESGLCQRSAG